MTDLRFPDGRPVVVPRWVCTAGFLFLALVFRTGAAAGPGPVVALPKDALTLRILSPSVLELQLDQTVPQDAVRIRRWDFVEGEHAVRLPAASAFDVIAGGVKREVQAVGFKRRVSYAPLVRHDLRVASHLYLHLAAEITEDETVEVRAAGPVAADPGESWSAVAAADRSSPAIHINQAGYLAGFPKQAIIGYYLGSLGELLIPADDGFRIVDAVSGKVHFSGVLARRPDQGYTYSPRPYQEVWEADFSVFDRPGHYRLQVPGLGVSAPFRIDDGLAMNAARAYALGLYHQRCGAENALPFTRFLHAACHLAPAQVPLPAEQFAFTWSALAGASTVAASDPTHRAPPLDSEAAQRFPYVNRGAVDVQGGHHDAGDYSKYTTNSAAFIHTLIFAVDSLRGAGELDNLGLPESGDGVSDLLQIAKWETDFLARMQDADGGFYFLVYPRDRPYENNVLPDHGDPQVVWPKTTAATAAATAALAQAASSPAFKNAYPDAARRYLKQARRGWDFLMEAFSRYGRDEAYQRITHYGDNHRYDDELAWAACELFLATGEAGFHQWLQDNFDPADPDTRRWGWWRLNESYGNAVRSYAFGVHSGRVDRAALDAMFLAKAEREIEAAGRDALAWSEQSAYGTSFPEPTKRVRGGGWYFSLDQAFDLAVAAQLDYPAKADPRPAFREAYLANLNYELGVNPVNRAYITGLGDRRQLELVHQFAQNDRRALPPSGLPVGNLQTGQPYLDRYRGSLGAYSFPSDGAAEAPYPFYDRWSDTYNVSTEFVIVNQARALAGLAWLAAQTPLRDQPWRPQAGVIAGLPESVPVGRAVTLRFEPPEGMDPAEATVIWEARDQPPTVGPVFSFSPSSHGVQWVEAEAQWPDGRRVFAVGEFRADNGLPVVTVAAATATASVEPDRPGIFRFHRTGSLERPLTVHFDLRGDATKWNDYRRREGDMPVEVTFPPGSETVTLTIHPVADSLAGAARQVLLVLAPDENYNIESPHAAVITLLGRGAPEPAAPPALPPLP